MFVLAGVDGFMEIAQISSRRVIPTEGPSSLVLKTHLHVDQRHQLQLAIPSTSSNRFLVLINLI